MPIKDPFKNIPTVIDEDPDERSLNATEDSDEVTKGNPPRKIFSSISSMIVPIVGLGIGAWLFLDTSGPTRAAPEKAAVVIDQTKQVSDTNSLMTKLREDDAKAELEEKRRNAAIKSAVSATSSAANNPVVSMPQGAAPSVNPVIDKVALDKIRRNEEIRSSPLEAGSFKLIGGTDLPTGSYKSKATEIESEIAEFNKQRNLAGKDQESAQLKMLAALSKNEPVKNLSSNENFLQNQNSSSGNNQVLRQEASASNLILNQGSVIRSVLLSGVNSDLPGKIVAQVTSDVYDSIYQKSILIPKGSRLVGAYSSQVVSGQSRLLVAMNRLILPNGTWISLAGTSATDMIGQSGLEADVNNHFFKMFSTSLILGASTLLLPKDQNTISSTTGASGTTTGGSLFGLALNDVLKTTLDRNRSIPPTLTLKYGDEFLFLAAQDMSMVPYRP